MANAIKQTNNGFGSIYKGNFSIGINNRPYGGSLDTGFWSTIPATSASGSYLVAYLPKGSDGPSIYETGDDQFSTNTSLNQYRNSLEGPFITTSAFTTTQKITIPATSTASTYPLEFNVSGIDKTVNWVTLTLGILSGTNVQNLGIVLVAPDNTTYALLKGSLNAPQSTGGEISVILEPFKGVLENTFPWDGYSSGNYNSNSNNGPTTLSFDSPCPVGPFSSYSFNNGLNSFTNFLSGNSNGTWSLYIQDFGGDESTLLYSELSFTFGGMMNLDAALQWATSNDNIVLLNRDYPDINVDGLQLLIDPWYLPSANSYASFGVTFPGNKISDLTNNNNDASPTGVIYLGGTNYNYWDIYGTSLTFNSVTNIPTGNSAYTTSIWFKTSSNGSLITFGNDAAYEANFLYLDGAGYVVNQWNSASISSLNGGYYNNVWHNAVITYNGTTARIYIDGVFENDAIVGTPLNVGSASNLTIGGSLPPYGISNLNGSMGPVMIYNRELTASEIYNNYNNILTTHGYI